MLETVGKKTAEHYQAALPEFLVRNGLLNANYVHYLGYIVVLHTVKLNYSRLPI